VDWDRIICIIVHSFFGHVAFGRYIFNSFFIIVVFLFLGLLLSIISNLSREYKEIPRDDVL